MHDRIKARADWHLLEGQYHEVLNETERGRSFALIRAFLDENFPLASTSRYRESGLLAQGCPIY